ncbi:MAG: penicillin acylase family protein, partial [Candidatus Dormibacteria bacterium]
MRGKPWADLGRRAGLATLLAIGVLTAAGAPRVVADTQPPYQLNDYGRGHVFGITPPGEDGLNTVADALASGLSGGGVRRKHNNDTLPLYANLLYNYRGLTDAQIPQYFTDESFGVAPGKLERTETLRSDVTVYRDNYDIPHIYGQTDAAMAFGAGYVAAEDRLFFMDVLRHVGSGTLTTFLGPSCADERMDHEQLLLTGGYSDADKLRQIDQAASLDPVLGPRAKAMAEAYIEGINRYIGEAVLDPIHKLPADYGVVDPGQHTMPQTFSLVDFVDVASVIGGQLGRGGGNETANAAMLSYLNARFGHPAAAQIFRDFREQNDPAAPTTSDFAFPYEQSGAVDTSLTVMPAYDASDPSGLKITPTTPSQTADCDLNHPTPPQLSLPSGNPAEAIARSLISFPKHMSNALLIDAKHSATGHPLAVFGSQAAYFAPEIWMSQDLHSPNYDAAGFSIPGISPIIEIGRGQDYAWSATSASTDNVDLRVETLCGGPGDGPAGSQVGYWFNGQCRPIEHRVITQVGASTAACMCIPATFRQDVYITGHGVVQGWTTSQDGTPVAIVQQRSTYEREPASVIGFLRWGTPALTHDAQSWMAGTYQIEFPFNWLYVDDRDIAYAVSGRDPLRPANVDPSLPVTGDGGAEWTGFLSDAAHPHQIGSAKGYLTSWNNKPAHEFSAADSQFGYGPTYRSQSLDDAITAQFAAHHGKLTQANVVTAMETAATVDLEGTRLLPDLLPDLRSAAAASGRSDEIAMVAELGQWLADGAHRKRARQGDPQYAHASAVAIMDELYPRLVRAVFDGLFADPALAAHRNGVEQVDKMDSRYDRVPFEWANNPGYDDQHLGSAYDGGWDGYLQKLIQQLHHKAVPMRFSEASTAQMCTGGLTTCEASIANALAAAADQLKDVNTSDDVSTWTMTTASQATQQSLPDYDSIRYRAIGIVGQPMQDWQNRPTQQQVVMFPAHRPRGTPVSGPPL